MYEKSKIHFVRPSIAIKGSETVCVKASNLSDLHEQALLIHPEWLNGLNATLKTPIGMDKYTSYDILATANGIEYANYVFNYIRPNENISKVSSLQFTVDPWKQYTQLSVCYEPSFKFRLKFKNHFGLFPSDENVVRQRFIFNFYTRSDFNVNCFGKTSTMSISACATHLASVASSISYLTNITSKFAIGAELNYCRNFVNQSTAVLPCLAAVYSTGHSKIVASLWLKSMKLDFSWLQHFNDQIKIGLTCNINNTTAFGTLFGQFDVGNSVFRAKISSKGLVGASLEQKCGRLSIAESIVSNVFTKKAIFGMNIGFELWIKRFYWLKSTQSQVVFSLIHISFPSFQY